VSPRWGLQLFFSLPSADALGYILSRLRRFVPRCRRACPDFSLRPRGRNPEPVEGEAERASAHLKKSRRAESRRNKLSF